MPIDPNSSSVSAFSTSPPPSGRPTEGPVPLPADSPFLSDHGLGGTSPPPQGFRYPAEPPSDLSQFPPSPPPGSSSGSASSSRTTATQAVPRAVPAPGSTPPAAPVVAQDSISSLPGFLAGDDPFAPAARNTAAVPAPGVSGAPANPLVERLARVLITTTDSLQGRLVEQYLGIVTAEAVVPTDTFLEGAERTGRFSRYKTSQQKLKVLHQLVLAEIKLDADKLGGNAILGVQLKVTMDQGIVLCLATGTAVRVS